MTWPTFASAAAGLGSLPVPAGRRTGGATPPGPMASRRMSVPWVLSGLVLCLTLAVAGAVVADRVDTRLPLLAVTRDLHAGDTITAADVTVVRVAADAQVATVPAGQMSTVVGHAAAMPLAAGSLLAPGQVGAAVWPPAGQAVIAVPVKPGRAPAGMTAGAHVLALVVPAAGAGGTTSGAGPAAGPAEVVQARAVVVAAEPAADQSGATVVSLLLAAPDATRVAAATGEVTVVVLGGGG